MFRIRNNYMMSDKKGGRPKRFFLSSVSFAFIETIIGCNLKIATDYCFFFDKSPFCELHAGYWHRYEAELTTYIVT